MIAAFGSTGQQSERLGYLVAGWRYKKPLIWTASALGVIAALGAGTLLVRPLLAKALRDRINKKRADVEEASQETGPHESSPLKVLRYSDVKAALSAC